MKVLHSEPASAPILILITIPVPNRKIATMLTRCQAVGYISMTTRYFSKSQLEGIGLISAATP